MNYLVPSVADLEHLLAEATAETEQTEYVESYLTKLVDLLKSNPRTYRAYGPYWWAIKRMLINRLISDFGDNVEAVTVDKFFIEDEANTIVAAWSYQNYQFTNGNQTSPFHVLPLVDDEDYEYCLVDDSMENLIAQSK
ncbi:peptide-binding protein [Photobacterium leiognathi]|uniref:peptide-binding protein n=1 Tax=Photobacterium leiognathi TaxID=553611 RepID=UPI002980D975|nr:peptide-binding protein [Photobacterium leiognathi]